MFRQSISKNISECRESFARLGIKLYTGYDLDEFQQIVSKQHLRHALAPAFTNNTFGDIYTENYWMAGFNLSGELVLTQAIKLLDLHGATFSSFLNAHSWDFHPYGYDADVTDFEHRLTEAASKISGWTTYHGELWLKGGKDGMRGGATATLFTRLILMEALMHWEPDYMIGLQSPVIACSGLGTKESYVHTEQHSLRWCKEVVHETIEGWLVWMNRQEAYRNLQIPARFFEDMLSETADELRFAAREIEFAPIAPEKLAQEQRVRSNA